MDHHHSPYDHSSICNGSVHLSLQKDTQLLLWKPLEYSLGSLHVTLGLLSVTCNLVVILNYIKEGGFRNTCYLLFINLAVTDTVTGVIGFHKAFHFFYLRAWFDKGYWDDFLCRLFAVLLAWMPSATLVNLALASLIRAVAIVRPLQYKRIINIKTTWLLIAACWIFTLVAYCILPMLFAEFKFNFFWASCQYKWMALTHEAYDVLETVLMYVPLLILITSNVTTGWHLFYNVSASQRSNMVVLKKIISMTTSYFLVYSFVITYDLVMVLQTIGYDRAFTETIGKLECRPKIFSYVVNWYDLSMLINSNMNPLIHLIFGREFKRQIVKRVSTVKRKVSNAAVYFNNKRKESSIADLNVIAEEEGSNLFKIVGKKPMLRIRRANTVL